MNSFESNFNIYTDIILKQELEKIPYWKIMVYVNIVDDVINEIKNNVYEHTCVSFKHNVNNRQPNALTDFSYAFVTQLWKDFSGAREDSGGFVDHNFWDFYPSFIQKKIRIRRLKKFKEQLYLLFDEVCGKNPFEP